MDSRPLRWVAFFLAAIILSNIIVFNLAKDAISSRDVVLYDVVTMVGHVPIVRPDMELIYTNYATDTSYYRYIGDKVTPNIGDTVYTYEDVAVEFVAIVDGGFIVQADPGIFTSGMSNTPIHNADGTVIGYVSTLRSDGKCYCIWE